ncbi:MAG: DUF6036 family nucleotidyltransferase [Usitatibacter sp.]
MTTIELRADPEYWKAFAKLMSRIESGLGDYKGPPVPVYVAGGAAAHIYTGARFSDDIDASISLRRFLYPENLAVTYKGGDGAPRTLYFDTQYNDTLGILHEDAHHDSIAIDVPGVNRQRLDVRVLSPLDLAVSKLARFEEPDQEDIRALAKARLIDSKALRSRAEEALAGYIGRVNPVKISIDQACRLIDKARLQR